MNRPGQPLCRANRETLKLRHDEFFAPKAWFDERLTHFRMKLYVSHERSLLG
jgi:hypothetical protein